jgi:hypothetical protein
MGRTADILADVRAQLAPDDRVLDAARERRDLVRDAAESFYGAQRSFRSGSLAHGTANCPIHRRDRGLDADAGVVLNRRFHPTLGPDSPTQEGPSSIVEQVRSHLELRVRNKYPNTTLDLTKRAILISFHEPLPSGEDPTVDLIVALERRDQPGLWIPNTEAARWDPSHPEKHTQLLNAEPKSLRVARARSIRLAKAENKRTGTPPLSSFNLEALAWMFVAVGVDEAQALLILWSGGAADLAHRLTPDPAGVSAPIKVHDRAEAVRRLEDAARRLSSALSRDDDEHWVRAQLQPLWPEFIADQLGAATKARAAAQLRSGASLRVTGTGALSTEAGLQLKRPRSFGGRS